MALGNDSLRQKEQRAFDFQSDFIQIAARKGNTTYFFFVVASEGKPRLLSPLCED